MKACLRCGAVPPEGAQVCNNCGASMLGGSSQYPPQQGYYSPQQNIGIGTGMKLAIGGCLGVLLLMGACTVFFGVIGTGLQQAAKQSGPGVSSPATSSSGITLAKFNQIKDGMTYSEVVRILGKEGTESSSNTFGDIKTVMYTWEADGFASMNAMFQNGKLVSKSQFGLK